MKLTKKLISLLFSVLIILSCFIVGMVVSNASVADNLIVVTTLNKDYPTQTEITDKKVTVTYYLTAPEMIVDGQGFVTYDNTKLRLVSMEFPKITDMLWKNESVSANTARFSFSKLEAFDFTNGGEFVVLIFEVIGDAKGTASVDLTIEELDAADRIYFKAGKAKDDSVLSSLTTPSVTNGNASSQPTSSDTTQPTTDNSTPTVPDVPTPTESETPSTTSIESEAPSTTPVESETPSTTPTESETPSTDPIESETQGTTPTGSETPSTDPIESETPGTTSTGSETPSTDPPESETPGTTPPESETPGTTPTESETPGTTPTESETPSTDPIESETPGTTPTGSETPSTDPPESETPPPTPTETQTPTQPTTKASTTQDATVKPAKNVGKGADGAAVESAIVALNNDKDPKGSTFNILQVKNTSTTKKSIKITYKKPRDTKTFVIYGNRCGKKYKVLKKTTAKSFKYKNLKKGKYYKFLVVALNSKGKVVATSKTIHVATKGGKVTNPKKVKITNASKAKSIKKGTKLTLKTKVTAQSKKLTLKNHRRVKFESTNTSVVNVTASGKITAKKKGTATIYSYAQNGVMAKVKVTVK